MKVLTAAVASLALLASACARADRTAATPEANAVA